jgi:hypothetical protein
MTHPSTKLYALAKDGATEKYNEADALIDRDGNYLEISEIQYCAAILDDFARQLYNNPAMWEEPCPAEDDWMSDMADYRNRVRCGLGL